MKAIMNGVDDARDQRNFLVEVSLHPGRQGRRATLPLVELSCPSPPINRAQWMIKLSVLGWAVREGLLLYDASVRYRVQLAMR